MKTTLRLITLLLCAVLLIGVMCGCSMFSTQKTEDTKSPTSDIKIDDNYTHKAPTDMDIATSYVYTTGINDEMIGFYKEGYGVDFKEQFFILYADKEDNALCTYEYYVFNTPEDSDGFIASLAEFGSDEYCEKLGNIVLMYSDQEFTQSMIEAQKMYAGMADSKASTYASFMKEANLMVEYYQD